MNRVKAGGGECEKECPKDLTVQHALMSSYCFELIDRGLCRKFIGTPLKGTVRKRRRPMVAYRDVIRIDVDSSLLPKWQEEYLETRRAILERLGIKVVKVIIRKSGELLPWIVPTGGLEQPKRPPHFHLWLHIETPKPLSDLERLKLQFLAGDDLGRCHINWLRITKRRSPLWDKLFGYIAWRRPLEEPCKSCGLRIHLEELEKEAI